MPSDPTPIPPENSSKPGESREATDDLRNRVQQSSEQKSRAEARGGMDELLDSQSAHLKDLKALKPSGISHYGFGNPFRENPELQEEAERHNLAIRGEDLNEMVCETQNALAAVPTESQQPSLADGNAHYPQAGNQELRSDTQTGDSIAIELWAPSIDALDNDGWQASSDGMVHHKAEHVVAQIPTDGAPGQLFETREQRKARLLEELKSNPIVGDKPVIKEPVPADSNLIAMLKGPGPAPERGAGQAEDDLPKPKPIPIPKIESIPPSPQPPDSSPIFKHQPIPPKPYDTATSKPATPALPGVDSKPSAPMAPVTDAHPQKHPNAPSHADIPIFKPQPIAPKQNQVFVPKPMMPGTPTTDTHVPAPLPKIQPLPQERLPQPIPPSEFKTLGGEVRNDAGTILKMQIENMKLEQQSAKDLREAREELKTLARTKIQEPVALKQFLEDMNTFEQRYMNESCRERRHEKMNEVKDTFEQINKLLSAEHDALENQLPSNLKNKPWRQLVAEQFMRHAADPTSIDQGKRAVCPTAALQARQYVREPACIARMLTDVVLTGKYHSTLGNKEVSATACPNNFLPDWESQRYDMKTKMEGYTEATTGRHLEDSSRSYASQLYDVVATNLILNGKGWAYEQVPEPAGGSRQEQDKQKIDAYVVNLNNPLDRRTWQQAMSIEGSPISITCRDLVRLNDYVTGKRERGFVLEHSGLGPGMANQYEMRKGYDFWNLEKGTYSIHRQSDFLQALRDIDRSGQWPPIIRIDTQMAPFNKSSGGAHFILAKELSGDGKRCQFDNFWGKDDDYLLLRSVEVSELAAAIDFVEPDLAYESKLVQQWPQMKAVSWEDRKKKFQTVASWAAENVSESMKQQDVEQKISKQFNDPTLSNWIKRKPYDKLFKEWDHCYKDWLRKYPDEELEKKK